MRTADVLYAAADLAPRLGPDPEGCIRAAVYGRPDVMLPLEDTAESQLVERACDAAEWHVNPDSQDVDENVPLDEWAVGRSIADVRGALFGAADGIEAGAL